MAIKEKKANFTIPIKDAGLPDAEKQKEKLAKERDRRAKGQAKRSARK